MAKKNITSKKSKRFAQEYVEYLQVEHHLPIKQAYLFGSYAKKKQRHWSDIDVCIISPDFKKIDPLAYLWTRRRDIDIERGIEPYGIAPEDFVEINPIAYEVKKYGITLL
ncbi:MAG: nucleotidyltransferase domain-containing protein [Candidatus Kerfeldbacteria bacterium]|nr:nucleotidyltransferase domain-containing protein [Candidatus Kerfeldbacteria bacterium]